MAPRVTALVAEPRDRVRVELDGEPWRSLPAAAVVGARLAVGTELDRPRARTLRRELRRIEALDRRDGRLARRDRSTAGVAARLERRGVAPGERASVLEALERPATSTTPASPHPARRRSPRAATATRRSASTSSERAWPRTTIGDALGRVAPESERAAAIVARSGRSAKTARRLAAKGFAADTVESLFE